MGGSHWGRAVWVLLVAVHPVLPHQPTSTCVLFRVSLWRHLHRFLCLSLPVAQRLWMRLLCLPLACLTTCASSVFYR